MNFNLENGSLLHRMWRNVQLAPDVLSAERSSYAAFQAKLRDVMTHLIQCCYWVLSVYGFSAKHWADCQHRNMAASATAKANNRDNTSTDSLKCHEEPLSQNREIIKPTITELTKEVRTNILCTVEGCGKILPNTPALNMHLVKSHRVKVNAENTWQHSCGSEFACNCDANLANSVNTLSPNWAKKRKSSTITSLCS